MERAILSLVMPLPGSLDLWKWRVHMRGESTLASWELGSPEPVPCSCLVSTDHKELKLRHLPALLQISCETSLPCSLPAFSPVGGHQFLLWQRLSHTLCISVRREGNNEGSRYCKTPHPCRPSISIYKESVKVKLQYDCLCWIWGDGTVFHNYWTNREKCKNWLWLFGSLTCTQEKNKPWSK